MSDSDVEKSIYTSSVGEVTFSNELSKRLLLDTKMKEVWEYLSTIHDENGWLRFLCEVHFAATGSDLINLRSPKDKEKDLVDLGEAYKQISQISKRYGVDVAQIPVGYFFDGFDLDSIHNDSDSSYAVRGGNTEVTFKQYFDELKGLIPRQQALVKKPNHKDILYQYFTRRVYLYLKGITNQPNQWKVLSIISSVSLEKDFLPSRVKGTCQDLQ